MIDLQELNTMGKICYALCVINLCLAFTLAFNGCTLALLNLACAVLIRIGLTHRMYRHGNKK